MKRPFYNAIQSLLYNRGQFCAAIIVRMRYFFPAEYYLKLVYWFSFGKRLDLETPKTFNEKLQWLKLYYHRPDFVEMVDKEAVKKQVASKIGEEYVIPTIGSWERIEDIEWDTLPNQFVLKTTHDSGNNGVVICRDKTNFNKVKGFKKLKKSLNRNTYLLGREWPYKMVQKKVIAEKYLEDSKSTDLKDYKFFCFDGKVKMMFVASERTKVGEDVKFDYFDENYCHLDLKQVHNNSIVCPEKPQNFELMIDLAQRLSAGIPHVRVDFYEVDGRVFFGEFTFFHHGGMVPFVPEKYDYILGSYLNLPEKIL